MVSLDMKIPGAFLHGSAQHTEPHWALEVRYLSAELGQNTGNCFWQVDT